MIEQEDRDYGGWFMGKDNRPYYVEDLVGEFVVKLLRTLIGGAVSLGTALWLERMNRRKNDEQARNDAQASTKQKLRGKEKLTSL